MCSKMVVVSEGEKQGAVSLLHFLVPDEVKSSLGDKHMNLLVIPAGREIKHTGIHHQKKSFIRRMAKLPAI
jgi:hypothetical protein